MSFFLLASCRRADIVLKVTEEVINYDYIGNGAEWDPYDEAIAWDADLSDEDWNELFARVDRMRPGYVRCMINSPYLYWDASSRSYEKTRNVQKICRFLCRYHILFQMRRYMFMKSPVLIAMPKAVWCRPIPKYPEMLSL